MNKEFKVITIAVGILMIGGAHAQADAIEGMWKRPASKGGTLEQIAPCGNSYCVTVRSGEFNGKIAGKFKKSGNKYVGEITDLAKKKTYSGSIVLDGNNKLKLSGCVLKVICAKETWTRQ